jgi:septal ring factor EnvC (AmiA/AmiB activator)
MLNLSQIAARWKSGIAAFRQTVGQLTREIEARKMEIQRLEQEVQARKEEIQMLEQEVRARNKEIVFLKSEADAHKKEIQHLESRRMAAVNELLAIQLSTTWRVMCKVGRKCPPRMRFWLRRVAKLCWWIITPQRMPARVRFLRERKKSQLQR